MAAAPAGCGGPLWWRSTMSVGPWATEALGLRASAPDGAALQLLVVPGNPGLASFYTVFMEQLHAAFGGAAAVMAVSHAGHDAQDLCRGKTWCLDSQVAHKVDLLRQHVLHPAAPPTVVLAHSIGSHIMLRAVQQLEEERQAQRAQGDPAGGVAKVVLLMPFLEADWGSTRQRLLRFLANNCQRGAAAAAAAVGSLPARLQDLAVLLVDPRAEPHARDGMKRMMRGSSVHNNLHLASHEFRDLDSPVDWGLVRRLGRRVAVIAAPGDMWWPERHHEQLRSEVPGVEEVWHPELSHAFCLATEQCKTVAALVLQSVLRSGALPPQLHRALSSGGSSGSADLDVLLEPATAARQGGDGCKAPA